MAQINLHVTPEFEQALETLIRARGFASKSEAIRHVVQEAAHPWLVPPVRDPGPLQKLIPRRPTSTAGRRSAADIEREIDDEMEVALGSSTGSSTRPARQARSVHRRK